MYVFKLVYNCTNLINICMSVLNMYILYILFTYVYIHSYMYCVCMFICMCIYVW